MGRYIAMSDVMDHLVDLIKDSLSDNRIPNIREIIDRYHQQLRTYEQSDTREYKVIRKWVKRIIESYIPDVKFTQSVPNQPSRITIPDMEATILMLAEKQVEDDTKTEVAILKKTASILRRKTLEHIKNNPVIFQGTVENNQNSCPFVLSSFTKWLLSGPSTKKRNDVVESHINGLSQTISYNIMHNIITDRQAKYEPAKGENYRSRHSYVPEHNIALGLALRSYDRNNDVLKLLSAPNFGFTIPPRICVKWETAIGNAVLENMSKYGSYIPAGLVKN